MLKTIKTKSYLVNAEQILRFAQEQKFAIPHININNLEWVQAALIAAEEMKSPIILGVSEGAVKYIGGHKIVVDIVNDAISSLGISVPVVLHLDHGSYEGCFKAIKAGFSSVMFDGSHLPFNENLSKSTIISKYCSKKKISLELEIGTIGGIEDNIKSTGELANLHEYITISKLKFAFLAAGIGNIHGVYPTNWVGLDFNLLEKIATSTQKGIVLHGGSGIPDEMIKKAISLGVRKINVNTECQIAFSLALQGFFRDNSNLLESKMYDPRKYLKLGKEAIKQVCCEKMKLFGSVNRY